MKIPESFPKSWAEACPELLELASAAQASLEAAESVRPLRGHWFEAFRRTSPQDCKIFLCGQDPYYTDDRGTPHAHGLSFSVPVGTSIPPTLKNILKELAEDVGGGAGSLMSSDLSHWADQGVLLANAYLTTELGTAGAHKKIWAKFNEALVKHLGSREAPMVFILWGAPAQKYKQWIQAHHVVIESVHPSPLSVYRGFWGSKPFSRANQSLKALGLEEVNWVLGNPEKR